MMTLETSLIPNLIVETVDTNKENVIGDNDNNDNHKVEDKSFSTTKEEVMGDNNVKNESFDIKEYIGDNMEDGSLDTNEVIEENMENETESLDEKEEVIGDSMEDDYFDDDDETEDGSLDTNKVIEENMEDEPKSLDEKEEMIGDETEDIYFDNMEDPDERNESQSTSSINPYHNVTSSTNYTSKKPKFIFGHTTGHSGSSTVSRSLASATGCSWNVDPKFERRHPSEVSSYHSRMIHEPEDGSDCPLLDGRLMPMLEKLIKLKAKREKIDQSDVTYLDLGHFHNRFRTLECLADRLQDQVTFIKIRRNRYAIAMSFSKDFMTPCKSSKESKVLIDVPEGKQLSPALSICPRSDERIGGNEFTSF